MNVLSTPFLLKLWLVLCVLGALRPCSVPRCGWLCGLLGIELPEPAYVVTVSSGEEAFASIKLPAGTNRATILADNKIDVPKIQQ